MLLTVEQARAYIASTLSDDALRGLLDAAEEAIDEEVGRLDGDDDAELEEQHCPGGILLPLARRVRSISSVTEGSTALAEDDYRLRPSGTILVRRADGTNPALCWRGMVTVVYQPITNIANRERVQVELVKLDIAFDPGLASQTIGPWTETYTTGKPYPDQRKEILATLSPVFEGVR